MTNIEETELQFRKRQLVERDATIKRCRIINVVLAVLLTVSLAWGAI